MNEREKKWAALFAKALNAPSGYIIIFIVVTSSAVVAIKES